jgi:NAD(P)-dependent dehydrogenase (short-subunit alcohol dehydrogenase family)
MDRVDPEKVAEVYLVNAVGPTYLFLALKPLMDESTAPKWMAISSGVASVSDFEKYAAYKMYPYNASKAALNHFTKTIHVDYPHIVAFSISPG